jgi:hypothetical protein
VLTVLAQKDIALERIHQTYKVVDYTCQQLLRIGCLLDGGMVSLVVETGDGIGETYMVNGVLGSKEAGTDAVVDIAAAETNPITVPSLWTRMVGVPLMGEKQEEVALAQTGRSLVGSLKDSLAAGDIEQLILMKFTTLVDIKIIAVSMAAGGILFTIAYLFITHRTDGESPKLVALVGYQILAFLHDVD